MKKIIQTTLLLHALIITSQSLCAENPSSDAQTKQVPTSTVIPKTSGLSVKNPASHLSVRKGLVHENIGLYGIVYNVNKETDTNTGLTNYTIEFMHANGGKIE